MRDNLLRAVATCGLLLLACKAQAEVYGLTDDLNVGPAQDFIQSSVVCKEAITHFKMYERLMPSFDYDARKNYLIKFYTPYVKSGACGVIPTSTAYVIGIRTAMIKKDEAPASKYVVVRVSINGERLYVTPDGLQQTGFEILKTIQQENRRLGAPLVQ
ncbi:TPA: hypothetical protein ACXNRN_002344 [Pseudomonas aeruginosa]